MRRYAIDLVVGGHDGADVRFLAEVRNTNDTASLARVLKLARDVVSKIRALAKPVIASINLLP